MLCAAPASRAALAVCCLLALGPLARAADYYIDGSVITSGNGSAVSPYKTIQQGLNAAQPGDNVIVRAGNYTQSSTITFPRSGQVGLPITLKAAPSQTVLIQTQPGLNISLLQTARSYITIEDLIFDGNYSTANGLIRLDSGGAFQTFRRCEMRRQGNHLLRIDSNDLLVEDCHIHHAISPVSPDTDAHCTHSQTGFRHTFLRCNLHHATGDLWQGSRDGAWGDIIFDGCDLHTELADADCNGIAAGTPITENHLDTKNATGIVNSNVTVRNCLVHGTRRGRLAASSASLNLKDGVQGFHIYNNRLYDNAMTFRLRAPSTDYHIYNNLVYDNDSAVRLEDNITNLTFVNNTFYGNGTQVQDTGAASNLTWTNNIFGSAAGGVWHGIFINNLFWNAPAGWPAGNGDRSANPLFVNAAAFDLHMATGSPAIDAGVTLAEVTGDIDDDPRPIGAAFDIGADEFRYAGDLNADNHVDVLDLLILANSWDKSLDDPGYDATCDLNGDNTVDVLDLLTLADNWGE